MSRRSLLAALAALALPVLSAAPAHAQSPLQVGGKHVFWAQYPFGPDLSAQTNPNNLLNHGGDVEVKPKVYITFWGPEWSQGFSTADGAGHTYTSQQAQRYIADFLNNVGGSPWAGVVTQYCQNVPAGTFDCSQYPNATQITNPTRQLKGVWTDPSPVPAEIVTTGLAENITADPIAQEAVRSRQHFGYDPDATYFIFTPAGHGATAYGSVYCAYHTEVTETSATGGQFGINYAFMPYVPEQGAGCGQNSVNQTDDAYGHGFFDGFSIVAGHEYAEAETDPHSFAGFQDGWNDAQTNENGDKCAWTGLGDIRLANGRYYAVQPTWSNEFNAGQGGCAMARGS